MADILKVVFLDIDGVLNDGDAYDWAIEPKALFTPRCVKAFNRIITTTWAKIVVSSAWRHLYHEEHMSRNGFQELLRSHGIRGTVLGFTGDERDDRHEEISEWLAGNPVDHYVVIDDWEDAGGPHPFVQTAGLVGLTEADADKAIQLLQTG